MTRTPTAVRSLGPLGIPPPPGEWLAPVSLVETTADEEPPKLSVTIRVDF